MNQLEEQQSDTALLRVDGIGKRFGGVVALDKVDLTVAPGEICGVIGPNGAGKTTLFDVISGITPPSQGRVIIDGTDATSMSSTHRARRGLRRTFQRVQTYGWLTVEDNILCAMEWRGGGGGLLGDLMGLRSRRRFELKRRERVAEVLEWCGLQDVRKSLAGSLPLGRARVLELARAVADRPSLLLLDEPASGLDRGEAERFGELITRLRGEGCALLLVEHNVGFVMRMCDRVVVLNLGAVLAEGLPAEIREDRAVRDAYLG
jgi:branched-chain amino acid transport system ATP-binding protein